MVVFVILPLMLIAKKHCITVMKIPIVNNNGNNKKEKQQRSDASC